MPRTDNDSWEITESVGATALGVAAARAADTESEHPLIDDPFARVFLDAAGDGMWNWFGNPELPDQIAKVAPDVPLRMQGTRDYMASRTAFFDEFFIDATEAGVPRRWPSTGPSRPAAGSRCRWICATTGQRRCGRRVLTPLRRASGRPKA